MYVAPSICQSLNHSSTFETPKNLPCANIMRTSYTLSLTLDIPYNTTQARLTHSSTQSGTSVSASIWSVIEPGVGIICASLPSMGPILRKAFPLGSSRDREPREINLLSSSSWKKMPGQNKSDDMEKQRQASETSSEFLHHQHQHQGAAAGQRSEMTLTS